MIVNRAVTRISCQGPAFSLWDMLKSSGLTVSLGETEIYAVDKITITTASIGHEFSRLDISMYEMTRFHELDILKHLICNQ
jgi:hypothetical protein